MFFLTLLSLNTYSQENQIVIPKIDSLIQNHIKEGLPGCVVGVIKGGEFIHKKAY